MENSVEHYVLVITAISGDSIRIQSVPAPTVPGKSHPSSDYDLHEKRKRIYLTYFGKEMQLRVILNLAGSEALKSVMNPVILHMGSADKIFAVLKLEFTDTLHHLESCTQFHQHTQ